MEIEYPKRKHPRLCTYDYSLNGAYFVTICTHNRRCFLSHITTAETDSPHILLETDEINTYTEYGEIAARQLSRLEERYSCLAVDRHVIMPNHIHAILMINQNEVGSKAAEADPRPTLMDIICSYKSLTTRECRKNGLRGSLFQTSFYEHIIRNEADYERIAEYINENPARWYADQLFSEE